MFRLTSKKTFLRGAICASSIFAFSQMKRNFAKFDIMQDGGRIMMEDHFGDSNYQHKLKNRTQHVQEILDDNNFDLLIVGGGATGAGTALGASAAGLRSLVIDSHDFSAGASSKSSKLIHGGVRYLEKVFAFDFSGIKDRLENYELVKEASMERERLINNAPHLTRYLPIVLPTTNVVAAIYYYVLLQIK